MFYKIKIIMLKKSSVKIVILILSGIMGICMFHNRTYDYLAGPEDMMQPSFKYSEGKYVKYNLEDIMVMGCFLERKDRDIKGNIIDYYYYILGTKNRNSDSVNCIVVMTDSEKMEIYSDYNRCFKNKIKGKSCDSPEPFTDSGILVPMSSFVKGKFVENLIGYYGADTKDKVYYEPYCIIPYKPGIIDVSVCFVSVVFIIAAVLDIIVIFSGLKQRKIRKYLISTGGLNLVENDYQYSRFFNSSIRVGDIYTYLLFADNINLIENKKIMWIYECKISQEEVKGIRPDAGYSGIEIWDNEYNCYEIFSNNKKMIDSILDYAASQFPHIIVGYNKMLSDLYFNDNIQFGNLAYNKYSGQTRRTEELYE